MQQHDRGVWARGLRPEQIADDLGLAVGAREENRIGRGPRRRRQYRQHQESNLNRAVGHRRSMDNISDELGHRRFPPAMQSGMARCVLPGL
ncbi:hypothetical protein [Bradyrhizobium viridifuturi]|uniref:hypothetical protein n=1 Tax=Bradyrhizobium viridifuturi TaxID=1654716 RepID=UPI001FCCCC6B|nr:hypothetical protein [Bradyrhizobium viridifuturi]